LLWEAEEEFICAVTVVFRQSGNRDIQVELVEIKDVEIPEAMQRAMAREAEAEREAQIKKAEGAKQAEARLKELGFLF